MLAFGIQNCLNDLASFRAPSLIPLSDVYGERADRRRADRPVLRSSRSSTAGATASRARKTPTISRGIVK